MSEIIVEHILPPSDNNRLEKLLEELDQVIIPRLSDRVAIPEYAEKLSEYAELFYVIESERDIGNCAIYLNHGEVGYISSIAIKKEWQNRGIGKQLWESVLEYAISKKIKTIELEVSRSNEKALAFYKKLDFVEFQANAQWIKMRYDMEEEFK